MTRISIRNSSPYTTAKRKPIPGRYFDSSARQSRADHSFERRSRAILAPTAATIAAVHRPRAVFVSLPPRVNTQVSRLNFIRPSRSKFAFIIVIFCIFSSLPV